MKVKSVNTKVVRSKYVGMTIYLFYLFLTVKLCKNFWTYNFNRQTSVKRVSPFLLNFCANFYCKIF